MFHGSALIEKILLCQRPSENLIAQRSRLLASRSRCSLRLPMPCRPRLFLASFLKHWRSWRADIFMPEIPLPRIARGSSIADHGPLPIQSDKSLSQRRYPADPSAIKASLAFGARRPEHLLLGGALAIRDRDVEVARRAEISIQPFQFDFSCSHSDPLPSASRTIWRREVASARCASGAAQRSPARSAL